MRFIPAMAPLTAVRMLSLFQDSFAAPGGIVPAEFSESCNALVSVILPAFNAEETLAETLASIASQTYGNLEILIVDDGSTDRTSDIADGFCRADPRARLIHQANAGVAAARNAGIARSNGAFIAPIDSDDLWHPEKVARQVTRLLSSSEQVGLVYNWSRIIDDKGIVTARSDRPVFNGGVLREHLRWNFIGNGSTPMFRSAVFRNLGYDPALRAAGHEGCEDFLLQLQAASNFEFVCEPAFLTGYRLGRAAMSSDLSRMILSHVGMYDILLRTLPREFAREVEKQRGRQLAALAVVDAARGRYSSSARSLVRAITRAPSEAVREVIARLGPRRSANLGDGLGRNFTDLSPDGEVTLPDNAIRGHAADRLHFGTAVGSSQAISRPQSRIRRRRK